MNYLMMAAAREDSQLENIHPKRLLRAEFVG
jgi:hypothetical protein